MSCKPHLFLTHKTQFSKEYHRYLKKLQSLPRLTLRYNFCGSDTLKLKRKISLVALYSDLTAVAGILLRYLDTAPFKIWNQKFIRKLSCQLCAPCAAVKGLHPSCKWRLFVQTVTPVRILLPHGKVSKEDAVSNLTTTAKTWRVFLKYLFKEYLLIWGGLQWPTVPTAD